MQIVGHEPTIVVDGAHNSDSMQKMLSTLHTVFDAHRIICVLGVARDKDVLHIVQELIDVDIVILTRANYPRAMKIDELQTIFAEYAPQVPIYLAETCDQALDLAMDLADHHDLIVATGSLYLAGEALRWAAAH
jgi:dihydrofolate synthase/folylpolyglutamate synthase